MIDGAADSHPSLRPGAMTLEKLFRWMTRFCASRSRSDGGGASWKYSSPYVASSTIGTRYRSASFNSSRPGRILERWVGVNELGPISQEQVLQFVDFPPRHIPSDQLCSGGTERLNRA